MKMDNLRSSAGRSSIPVFQIVEAFEGQLGLCESLFDGVVVVGRVDAVPPEAHDVDHVTRDMRDRKPIRQELPETGFALAFLILICRVPEVLEWTLRVPLFMEFLVEKSKQRTTGTNFFGIEIQTVGGKTGTAE